MANKIWIIVCIACVGILGLTMRVEAIAIIRSTGGPVQVFFDKEQIWKPLGDTRNLTVGDQILTGKDAFAELLLEDGSELYIYEETQLAFSELEFSLTQKIRNFRLKLFWGNIIIRAAKTDFEKNDFEIRTDTVITALKSSHLQIIAQETKSPQDTPVVTLRPIEGKFDIRQIQAGNIHIECRLDDQLTGITFIYNAVDVPLGIDMQPTESKIAVKADSPVHKLYAFFTQNSNTLRVENVSHVDLIRAVFGENIIILGQGSSAVFAISSDKTNQMLEFQMDKSIDVMFWFRQDSDITDTRMLIQSQRGDVKVNGEKLSPGESSYLPLELSPPVELTPEEEIPPEEPVAPSPPDSRAPLGGGVTPTPVLTPTPIQTPIPTPSPIPTQPGPTRTPIPAPTPTLTPTPTPTPTTPPAPPAPPRIPTASPVLP